MKDHALATFLLGTLLLSKDATAFSSTRPSSTPSAFHRTSTTSTSTAIRASCMKRSALQMHIGHFDSSFSDERTPAYYNAPSTATKRSSSRRQRRDQPQPLRAVAIGTLSDVGGRNTDTEESIADMEGLSTVDGKSGILEVLSAASLVTGSTVGAGMLILPQLAAPAGFCISSGLFLGIYLLVLTSGLVIADVAINQHESGYDVPSSFQEFAEATLDNEWMNKAVSAIPVIVNSLVMVFAISKAGDLGASVLSPLMDIDPLVASAGFVGMIGALLSTLSGSKLSNVASMCVSALLVAFGGLLLPGLAAVQDPMATLMAPGLDGDQWFASVATAAPIVLTSLQFQGIVPSLAKILNFDRTKVALAIALGSFMPLAMYFAWIFAVLGGGIDMAAGVASPLMTVFTAATLLGSTLGGAMGVTEEVQIFVSKTKAASKDSANATTERNELTIVASNEASEAAIPAPKKDVFALPAVLLSLAVPMAGSVYFSQGHDATAALGLCGSFGAPTLYGLIPALMWKNQRSKLDTSNTKSLVPGGLAGVGALGLAAALSVGGGMASHVTESLSVTV